jgi:hypothetical protein
MAKIENILQEVCCRPRRAVNYTIVIYVAVTSNKMVSIY